MIPSEFVLFVKDMKTFVDIALFFFQGHIFHCSHSRYGYDVMLHLTLSVLVKRALTLLLVGSTNTGIGGSAL